MHVRRVHACFIQTKKKEPRVSKGNLAREALEIFHLKVVHRAADDPAARVLTLSSGETPRRLLAP